MKWRIILIILMLAAIAIKAQEVSNTEILEMLNKQNEMLQHRLDVLEKQIDDVLWYNKVGDLCHVDKVFMTGPPVWNEKNPSGQGAGNPTKFWSYIFIPKTVKDGQKYPLIILPHGGVHASFDTYYTHIVREFMAQGYIIVAPEYRGSTGYGQGHYKKIDYGGLEIEDVFACKEFMIENYDIVDASHVGIVGWSHGGLLALMNIFDHPNDFQAAYAGVPVSDLIARMGYKTEGYRQLYEAEHHIGQSAYENVEEYRKRSPAWNVHKMKSTPLLIHTNTNDEDVNVLEVEHLIKSLKSEGKKFEYKIYQDAPGGHSFNRTDKKIAHESRLEIYQFLNKHLNPPYPIKSVKDLKKASYRF